MNPLGITAAALLALGAVLLGVSLMLETATMETSETTCPGEGCMTITYDYAWTWFGFRHHHDATGPDAHSYDAERTWEGPGDNDRGARGLLFVWLGLGMLAVGVVLVAIGMFTHPAIGVVGGVLGILACLTVGLALMDNWDQADTHGAQIAAELEERAQEFNREWNEKGPYWGIGLTLAAIAGVLGFVGGILGLVPSAYARD